MKKVCECSIPGRKWFSFIINLYLVFFFFSVSAALLRQITYGTIKIGIYQKIKRFFAEDIRRVYSSFIFCLKLIVLSYLEEKLHLNILNGMFSGALANSLANPTDLLKVGRIFNRMPRFEQNKLLDSYASTSSKCAWKTTVSGDDLDCKKRRCSGTLQCKFDDEVI